MQRYILLSFFYFFIVYQNKRNYKTEINVLNSNEVRSFRFMFQKYVVFSTILTDKIVIYFLFTCHEKNYHPRCK